MFFKYYKERRKVKLDQLLDVPKNYPIRLSENEKQFFINIIKNKKIKNYLEFGSGGSTFLALINSNANVYSVESDLNWISYLECWNIIKQNKHRLHFKHIFIGETGEWGIPIEVENNKKLFPSYSKIIFEKLSDIDFDLVFIDGRFRIACALQTALKCLIGNSMQILIHDFNDRPHYHVILNFFNIIDTADNMVLLELKDGVDKDSILRMYEEYKYDFE